MTGAVGLYIYKNRLNDDLLAAVRELAGLINKMNLEEWEEYKRRTRQ